MLNSEASINVDGFPRKQLENKTKCIVKSK